MKATEIIQRYVDVWNGRDADAFLAVFTKDGTYCNPDTYPGISGEALARFVKGVWTAFPDFSVELLNAGEIERGLIADHWRVRGTTPAPEGMAANPRDAACRLRELLLFALKETKIARITPILTGRR